MKGKSFLLKQTLCRACCYWEGIFTWSEDKQYVAVCQGQKGGKKSQADQFPKHICSVFLKWLSTNLYAFVCVCVHVTDTFYRWCCHCCWYLGCVPESLQTIYHLLSSNMHIHKGTHSSKSCRLLPPLFARVWPWCAVWTLVGTESV